MSNDKRVSRRTFLRAVGYGAGAVALASCAAPPAAQPQRPQPQQPVSEPQPGTKPLTFVWSPKAVNNPVFDVARRGAQDKAKELGITVEWVGPESADAQKQAELLDAAIARKVDGMGISCNDPDALKPVIDRAMDSGIPVITWDSDSPNSKRITFYSLDNEAAARKGAEIMVDLLKDSQNKTYAILTGVPGAQNLEARIKAFREVADPAGLQWVATDPCNDDIQKGIEVVENRLTANPDLAGYFMAGAWPLFGDINAMPKFQQAAKRGMKTVAWDILESELRLLKQGLVHALIGQKFYGWGYDAVGILYDIVVNKKQYPPFVDTGFDLVTTPEQADVFLKKWETGNWRD
ncbi:MAG: sugar-binding protein [Anaerolineae bacterium]|nr:sugar-binding protein [Thermoflexales bacterium]MDW8396804.1 sugar-binding protein [Anaerolineae bacterium]